MKKVVKQILPWLITVLAFYLALNQVDLKNVINDIKLANKSYLFIAASLTVLSYILRSWRWRYLLPENEISFKNLYKVLILGFFINNILPARAGEFARAHLGTKISNFRGTLVLASIAAERLVDGLSISLFLGIIVSFSTQYVSYKIKLVAYFFILVATLVILTLIFKDKILKFLNSFHSKENNLVKKVSQRAISFMDGLVVLSNFKNLLIITFSSIIIWGIELIVFYCSCSAFNLNLNFFHYVVLLVVCNFSSLIPSAPGAFGTIEYFGKTYLASVGVNPETAIAVIITQHFIQYIIVGIPGIYFMFTWGKRLLHSKHE